MRRAVQSICVVLAAACGESPSQPAPDAASILLEMPRTLLRPGESVQAKATVFGRAGDIVGSVRVAWTSSNAAVATISQSGMVTAVGSGRTTIKATASAATGSADVVVDAGGCGPALALAVGEGRTFIGADRACILLERANEPAEYLFITANVSTVPDQVRSYLVSASSDGIAAVGENRGSAVANADAWSSSAGDTRFSDRFESGLRATERRVLAHHSLSSLGAHTTRLTAGRAAAVQPPRVGDTLTYRVPDGAAANPCDRYDSVRAVVKAIGANAVVAQDVRAPAGGFTALDYAAIATDFDQLLFPTDTRWFGSPTDINGDGRITILYTPSVNRLTPPGALDFVGGFFFGADLFARAIPSEGWRCDASNEQEIFFMLTPDPAGAVNGNVRSTASVRLVTRGTIAHEFQHMINQGVRQSDPRVDSLEVPWLDEGLAHFAEEAVGRAARKRDDFARLSSADVLAGLDDYEAFFHPNLVRLRAWMRRPDLASPLSNRVDVAIAPRGAAWALVRYMTDRYGQRSASAFTRALVAGPEVGVRNLERRSGVPFASLLPGFLVAAYGTTLGGQPPAPDAFVSWSLREVMSEFNGGTFPLLATPLPADVRTQSPSGSGNYFTLARPSGGARVAFRVLAADGTPIDSDAAVYLLRVK